MQLEDYEAHPLEWFQERVFEELQVRTPDGKNDGPMFVKCINQARYYYNLQEKFNYQFFDQNPT